MNLLLVTFSLRDTNHDYSQFFVALRGNSVQWWHYIEQTCVVLTYHGPSKFSEMILPHILKTDSLLIVKMEPYQFQGWLPGGAWDWLHNASGKCGTFHFPQLPGGAP
jgi:hypothetical protein